MEINALDDTRTASIDAIEKEPDQILAEKVAKVPLPLQEISEPNLDGRVTEGRPSIELLHQVLLEQPNYLNELREVVAAILDQLSRTARTDRESLAQMRKDYEESYKASATYTKELGWNGLKFAGLGLLPLLLAFSPHQTDKDLARAFGEQFIPKFGEMWGSDTQARKVIADALTQKFLQQIGDKQSEKQSEGNTKEAFNRALDDAFRGLREAARSA